MTRIVFDKKLFARAPEEDITDDGRTFKVYLYKDKVRLTVTNFKDYRYICIQSDGFNVPFNEYKDDFDVMMEFNGVWGVNFNMAKLIENCEYIYQKYFVKKADMKKCIGSLISEPYMEIEISEALEAGWRLGEVIKYIEGIYKGYRFNRTERRYEDCVMAVFTNW